MSVLKQQHSQKHQNLLFTWNGTRTWLCNFVSYVYIQPVKVQRDLTYCFPQWNSYSISHKGIQQPQFMYSKSSSKWHLSNQEASRPKNYGTSSCPWAPCLEHTSRLPRAWCCSASRLTCCKQEASRWTPWTKPGYISQHRCHNPPESTASNHLGSIWHIIERWAGRTHIQPEGCVGHPCWVGGAVE